MYEQQLDKIEKAPVYMSVYDVQFWHGKDMRVSSLP